MWVKHLHNMASMHTWEIAPPQTHDAMITSGGGISVVFIWWTQARSAPLAFEFQGRFAKTGASQGCVLHTGVVSHYNCTKQNYSATVIRIVVLTFRVPRGNPRWPDVWGCALQATSQGICKGKLTIKEFINPLKTKRRPLYLKAQSVPRCKHFISVIKTNQFTL
jgi:hypothetical protein